MRAMICLNNLFLSSLISSVIYKESVYFQTIATLDFKRLEEEPEMCETVTWSLDLFVAYIFEEDFQENHSQEIVMSILRAYYPIFKFLSQEIYGGKGYRGLNHESRMNLCNVLS
jgi:hypothetical protein